MAVQFPTFQRTPAADYSGLGNALENMLSGYKISQTPAAIQRQAEMERYNNLIKAVEAEFARPKAESQLQSLQTNAKYAGPLAEALLKNRQLALRGAQVKAQQEEAFNRLLSGDDSNVSANMDMQNQSYIPSVKPSQTFDKKDNVSAANIQIISPGSENLYKLDQMYDANPVSRSFLEKKGFKKTQSVKFDPKTGVSAVITTWPSKKITIETLGGGNVNKDASPLTEASKTSSQSVIGAVTTAIPLIDKLINFETPVKGFSFLSPDKSAQYESITNQLSDQLLTALKLPKTNESLELVKSMTKRHFMESDEAYHIRMKDLKSDLLSRKKYSQGVIKGGVNLKEEANDSDPLGLFS